MQIKHNINYDNTAKVVAAAMLFKAKDENGNLFHKDKLFIDSINKRGVEKILLNKCKLKSKIYTHAVERIIEYFNELKKDKENT